MWLHSTMSKRGHIEVTPESGAQTVLEAGRIAIVLAEVRVNCRKARSRRVTLRQPRSRLSISCAVIRMQATPTISARRAAPRAPHRAVVRRIHAQQRRTQSAAGVASALAEGVHPSPGQRRQFGWRAGANGIGGWAKRFGSSFVIERLLELLCAEALGSHLESGQACASGWLGGLKDPVVGRAISLIHATPGKDWSVGRLAGQVAMSPSRFAARFSAALGTARWS